MEKSAVEIITDWIEKNINTIYYPEVDLNTYKETGRMYFNRSFVLSHLSGVMPNVKKRLQSRQSALADKEAADVTPALPLPEFLYEDQGGIFIGYHGDTEVSTEWNEWLKENVRQ